MRKHQTKGLLHKGAFSVPESLESLENARILLINPHSGNCLASLESLKSVGTLTFEVSDPFSKRTFPDAENGGQLDHTQTWTWRSIYEISKEEISFQNNPLHEPRH